MPATVYSERFLHAEGMGVEDYYTVPEGKRAIVTSLVCSKDTTPAAGTCWLQVHGIWVICAPLPVGQGTLNFSMRIVAYERETMLLRLVAQAMSCIVSGYLFDDPVGAPPSSKPIDPGYGQLPRPQPVETT